MAIDWCSSNRVHAGGIAVGGALGVIIITLRYLSRDAAKIETASDKKGTEDEARTVMKSVWARLRDVARPRLWYIKTLIKLKVQLFREHNNSRISFQVIHDFTDVYDAIQPPRLHPPTIDFITYAIKQLVGINDMWWILFAFCPLFMNTKTLCFWGRRLRSMITKYTILPGVSEQDQGIVQVDDIYGLIPKALEHLQQFQEIGLFSFEKDITWSSIPTIEMTLKGEDSLSVSYLPLNMAILSPLGPPVYGTYPDRIVRPPSNLNPEGKEEEFGGGKDSFLDISVYEDTPIPIFISHRWGAVDEPNADHDFMKLCQMLAYVIQCAIQASVVLLHAGFPLDQLILRQQHYMRRGKPLRHILSLDFTQLGNEKIEVPATQQISGQLQRDIFALTARVVLKDFWTSHEKPGWDENLRNELRRHWLLCVMKKIWLWYDYSCVPQRPLRDQALHLEIRFKRTLKYLAQLQQRSHTLSMNHSLNYNQRAWCMAEYINADASMHNGRSEFRRSVLVGQQPEHLVAYAAFELLINPMFDFTQVLEQLNLKFTNEVHTAPHSATICWILWNSVLRKQEFQDDYYAAPKENQEVQKVLLLGRGELDIMLQWVKYIKQALETKWPGELTPFWVADARASDSLKYKFEDWVNIRDLAFSEENEAIDVTVLIVPFEHGGRYGSNYLMKALDDVMSRLQDLSARPSEVFTTKHYEVYLQCTDDALEHGNNQDFIHDFDWY